MVVYTRIANAYESFVWNQVLLIFDSWAVGILVDAEPQQRLQQGNRVFNFAHSDRPVQ